MQVLSELGGNRYQPGGTITASRFVPMLWLALAAAVIMAFVLYRLEADFYYFIITPFIVSLPVLGAIILLIRKGECRNPVVGAVVGTLLMVAYYAGYWVISYNLTVAVHGPRAVEYIEREGGAPGILGYFLFRCKNVVVESTPSDSSRQHRESGGGDQGGAYFFYGIELVLLPLVGFLCGRHQSSRVFYEDGRRWSSSLDLRYAANDFSVLYDAIQNQNWAPLAHLARLPRLGGGHAGSAFVVLRIEYLRGGQGEPLYVTLTGTNMGKNPAAKAAGAKGFGGISKTFAKQICILPASAHQLVENITELKSAITAAPIAPAARSESAGGFRGILQRAGLTPQKLTGPDFRSKAVQESDGILTASPRTIKPADLNRSLCLIANPDSAKELKSAAWFYLKLILPLVAGIFIGIMLLAAGEGEPNRSSSNSALTIAGAVILVASLVGFAAVLVSGSSLEKRTLMRRLCRRPGALFESTDGLPTMLMRLEDAHTYHVMKATPQDICVCLLDQPRGRLLMEGICHRYIIYGPDVTKLSLLDTGPVTALQLNYRVGNEELNLVLSGYSLGRTALVHSPLFIMLAPRSANKLLQKFRRTLNLPDS